MSLSDLVQILVTGLTYGSVYGLLGLGYTIQFASTRVINFAHGDLLMMAVMTTAVTQADGWPLLASIALGIASSTLLSVATYVFAILPVLGRTSLNFAWLVSTLGVSIVIEQSAAIAWGSTSIPFPALLSTTTVKIADVNISLENFLMFAVAIFLVAFFEFVRRRTLAGKVAAAVALDPEMASAFSMNRNIVALVSFAAAGLMAGIAGILIAPLTFANAYMGTGFGIQGFVAIMLGGIGNPLGAIVGAFLLSLSEAFAANWIGGGASDWFPFVILLLVLLIRPRGIFAGRQVALSS